MFFWPLPFVGSSLPSSCPLLVLLSHHLSKSTTTKQNNWFVSRRVDTMVTVCTDYLLKDQTDWMMVWLSQYLPDWTQQVWIIQSTIKIQRSNGAFIFSSLVQTATSVSCALIKIPWPVCVPVGAVSVLHILIMITAKQLLPLVPWLSHVFFPGLKKASNVPHLLVFKPTSK